MIIHLNEFEVHLSDGYNLNPQSFTLEYPRKLGVIREFQASTKHGIRIYKNAKEISSAIFIETGGATGLHEKSFAIKEKQILLCCAEFIYSINLPDLTVNWRKQLDGATCFGIHPYQEDFIIHGELEITRINENGNVKWAFGPGEIFVTPDGKEVFTINEDLIEVKNWDGELFILNGNGEKA
ncbi:MAG: hypothetical protein AB8F78_03710 [Saprospiraceae bacterium]